MKPTVTPNSGEWSNSLDDDDDENDHLVHEHAAVIDSNSNATKSNDVDF